MKMFVALTCLANLFAALSRADEPFQNERNILAIHREDQTQALQTEMLKKEVTLTEAIQVLTTYWTVTAEQYLGYSHQVGADGSVTLQGGVTCLWKIEPGYAAVVTSPSGRPIYLLHPDLKVSPVNAQTTPTDDERLAELKPIMSANEINRLWQDKALHGQACGEAIDPRTGKGRGVYWNVYGLNLADSSEFQTMKFGYYEGADGYLFEVKGPRFRYEWRDGKYFAAEGPKQEEAKQSGEPVLQRPSAIAAKGLLWAAIGLSKPLVTCDQLQQSQLTFSLVNEGETPIDPKVNSWRLSVNGKEHPDSSLVFQNGPRDTRWQLLPPGNHLSFSHALGNWLKRPGVYTIVWKGDGFESAPFTFRVLDQKH